MPRIRITQAADAAIVSAALYEVHDPRTVVHDNGDRTITLDNETYQRLIDKKFPNETLSDTIIRILALYNAGGKSQ